MPQQTQIRPQTFGIIGAMEQEIDLLKHFMTDVTSQTFGKIVIYSGKLDGKHVSVCLSGIGKVNAAIATTLLIEHFEPDCIINTGSAGGLHPELSVGHVVIGTHIAHHDVDVRAFNYVMGQVPQMPARFASHPVLIQAAEYAASQQTHLKVMRGLIASGDQFIHAAQARTQISQHFPDILAVEMEAAAIAQTCTVLNKPFVIIRAISDAADDSAAISFDEFLNTASVHSAQMVRSLIQACQ